MTSNDRNKSSGNMLDAGKPQIGKMVQDYVNAVFDSISTSMSVDMIYEYLNKQIDKRNLAQDHKISQVCNTRVTVLGLLSATKTINTLLLSCFFVCPQTFVSSQFFSWPDIPISLAVPAHLHSTPAQRSEVWRSDCSHLLANDLPSGRHFRKGRSQSTCDRISGSWSCTVWDRSSGKVRMKNSWQWEMWPSLLVLINEYKSAKSVRKSTSCALCQVDTKFLEKPHLVFLCS